MSTMSSGVKKPTVTVHHMIMIKQLSVNRNRLLREMNDNRSCIEEMVLREEKSVVNVLCNMVVGVTVNKMRTT
jgi:hypothetical protein